MKSIFESAINRGGYDLSTMLKRIDTYHIEGSLTDEEREELREAARAGAQIGDSVVVMEKLHDLDMRVKALEDAAGNANEGGEGEGEGTATYPEYVAGKWYYAGDKITFNGKAYNCIAPEGQVCTWSPDEYPAYWELMAE